MQSIHWQKVGRTFLLLLVPGLVLYLFFKPVFACPSCYLFEDSGDGLKNYYTLAYYILHDQGWWFSGMNYPYGEHILYTDNQPILAMVLRWVHHHLLPLDAHVIGILNVLMLISIFLAILVAYNLLRRWKVGTLWAMASAMCVIFLSPQLLRLQGHYGMAYVVFIPLLLLLLDYMVSGPGKRIWWSLTVGILIIVMSLTHLYFLLLGTFLFAVYGIFWFWRVRKDRGKVRALIPHLLVVTLMPVVIMWGIKTWTDPVEDRPVHPYGIESHFIKWQTTFLSSIKPFDQIWERYFEVKEPITEKKMYTGLVGLFMLPVVFYFLLRRHESSSDEIHIKHLMWTAIICWCMAAGTFFNVFNVIWEAVPLLKQFRTLGRFGWLFYYIYMLICSFLLWNLYQDFQLRNLARTGRYLLAVILLVWGFEAVCHTVQIKTPIYHPNRYLPSKKEHYTPVLQAAGRSAEDFQAILQLPLVAVGNENMGVSRGFWTMREGIHASFETGLPLIDYSLSRTSVSHGMDVLELISSPYTPKRRAARLNEKPVLLLCEEEFMIPEEKKWIEKGNHLGTYASITLYSVPSAAFKEVMVPSVEQLSLSRECSGWFIDFENYPCDTVMAGRGALTIREVPSMIWSYTDTADTERPWVVSFWNYIDRHHSQVAVPRIRETDPAGVVISNEGLHREKIPFSEAYGQWIEIHFPLQTKGRGYHYELFIDNSGTVLDNLLIRSEQDTCLYIFPQMMLFNNLPMPAQK